MRFSGWRFPHSADPISDPISKAVSSVPRKCFDPVFHEHSEVYPAPLRLPSTRLSRPPQNSDLHHEKLLVIPVMMPPLINKNGSLL